MQLNCLLICLVAPWLTRQADYLREYDPDQVYGAWAELAMSVVNFSFLSSPLVLLAHYLLVLRQCLQLPDVLWAKLQLPGVIWAVFP